ncbi:unnamed protein product [Penicillium salamii]|uniref:NADP-dependent oxidoreductase domain-containing protein n=1 Tax=Penicillium salamii TaxID=1612424 RepID=A0A9W4N3P5_9EURO|nr:unnamed protein product [Penicillium salamii]CAG8244335.1 unnamed protein product [Penicillium salamii]CAG8387350.1 unnamed protein product [Penicillium salamii]
MSITEPNTFSSINCDFQPIMTGIKLIWGGASIKDEGAFPTTEAINQFLDVLQARGVKSIDTARIYPDSEERLGNAHADSRFAIDSKYPGGFSPVPSTPESLVSTLKETLALLQTDQLDVYYIHAPDRRSSLEDLLAALNTEYQTGKFKRFGLSNYLAEEVEEVIRISRENNYVLPTVYQGNYSAIARRGEDEIFPTLRKHNIAFYAYSPIGGGFLTKDVEQFVSGGEGRWDANTPIGGLYHKLYNKPSMLEGLRLWADISKNSGIPKAELAYRWAVHNSALKGEFGDGLIFGSRNLEQLKQTLDGLDKGPLSVEIAAQIDEVWKLVEADAPLDNVNSSSKS